MWSNAVFLFAENVSTYSTKLLAMLIPAWMLLEFFVHLSPGQRVSLWRGFTL